MKFQRGLTLVAIASIAAVLVWLNVSLLWEAYGGGPPYYGQTTNMDKWSSPWSILLLANGIGAAALLVLFRWGLRSKPTSKWETTSPTDKT